MGEEAKETVAHDTVLLQRPCDSGLLGVVALEGEKHAG